MKKTIALLLITVFCFSLCSCDNDRLKAKINREIREEIDEESEEFAEEAKEWQEEMDEMNDIIRN